MTAILGITGHRPQKLGLQTSHDYRMLNRYARKTLKALRPDKVITGMALGWDQAIAEACCILDIPFIAAVPFSGQESVWPSWRVRENYFMLLDKAESTYVVSKGGYSAEKMVLRNLWIVDNATEMLALWNGDKSGGTWNAVQAAEEIPIKVTNVWDGWLEFSQNHRLTYIP